MTIKFIVFYTVVGCFCIGAGAVAFALAYAMMEGFDLVLDTITLKKSIRVFLVFVVAAIAGMALLWSSNIKPPLKKKLPKKDNGT